MLIENLNLEVEKLTNNSENEKTRLHKHSYLLKQAKLIGKWISLFDPSNINTKDLAMPEYLENNQTEILDSLGKINNKSWIKSR